MAYIVEIIVSSPLANYPDLVAFESGVKGVSDPDVDTLIIASLGNGDLELHNKVPSEDATDYHLTSTFNWKDETTYLTATSDPTIADNQVALEANFDFVRNLP